MTREIDPKKTGERIKARMDELGLWPKHIYKRLYVQASTVHKWTSGQGLPSYGLLAGLCDILGVTADYLLFGDDKE